MDQTLKPLISLFVLVGLLQTSAPWGYCEAPADFSPDAPLVMASDLEPEPESNLNEEEPAALVETLDAEPIEEAEPIQQVGFLENLAALDKGLAKVEEPLDLKLPEWVDSAGEVTPESPIMQAFDLKSYLFDPGDAPVAPLPGVKPSDLEDDIGLLLSAAGDLLTEPTPSELVDQLERAASETHGAHMLARLVKRCHGLLKSEEFASKATPDDSKRLRKLTAWAHDARGRLRAGQGERMTALADFEQAIVLDPNCLSAIHNRAVSLAEAGREREALADFNRLIELDPSWGSTWRNRAELLLGLGEAEQALRDCDRALKAASTQPPIHAKLASLLDLRGRIVQRLGRPQEAARDFTEALRFAPEDPMLLHHRGNVFAEVGYYEQAVEDYIASLHKNPDSGEVYTALAWVLATCPREELRDPVTAVEAAWRARRLLNPQDERMLEAGAAAHAAMGEYEEAIRLQQRALLAAGDANAPESMQTRLSLYEQQRAYVNDLPAVVTDPAVLPVGHERPLED